MAKLRKRKSDEYLEAAEKAVARPGRWVRVRLFERQKNANVTKHFMQKGYLRVSPRDGQEVRFAEGKNHLAVPDGLECEVSAVDGGWLLRVRMPR